VSQSAIRGLFEYTDQCVDLKGEVSHLTRLEDAWSLAHSLHAVASPSKPSKRTGNSRELTSGGKSERRAFISISHTRVSCRNFLEVSVTGIFRIYLGVRPEIFPDAAS
jgi:hypothetical protein